MPVAGSRCNLPFTSQICSFHVCCFAGVIFTTSSSHNNDIAAAVSHIRLSSCANAKKQGLDFACIPPVSDRPHMPKIRKEYTLDVQLRFQLIATAVYQTGDPRGSIHVSTRVLITLSNETPNLPASAVFIPAVDSQVVSTRFTLFKHHFNRKIGSK